MSLYNAEHNVKYLFNKFSWTAFLLVSGAKAQKYPHSSKMPSSGWYYLPHYSNSVNHSVLDPYLFPYLALWNFAFLPNF